MSKFIYSVILLMTLYRPVSSQNAADTIYYDNQWNQSSREAATYFRLVAIDTNRIRFIVNDYYVSGNLQMEGAFRSINPDFKIGGFTYWYENGDKHIECYFEQNRLHGVYREWYPGGQLKSEMTYRHGILEGTEKNWDEEGNLAKTVEYKNGLKNGEFITYYKNGKPIRKDIYKNNKLLRGKCFTTEGKDTTYFDYFIMPRFTGNPEGFKFFVLEKLNYPDSARVNNEEGLVEVKFTIDSEGNLSHIRLVKRDKDYFNDEAVRVLHESPKWIPGKRDGKKIDVTITLPIHFKLK